MIFRTLTTSEYDIPHCPGFGQGVTGHHGTVS